MGHHVGQIRKENVGIRAFPEVTNVITQYNPNQIKKDSFINNLCIIGVLHYFLQANIFIF